jgi:hypothetical protein
MYPSRVGKGTQQFALAGLRAKDIELARPHSLLDIDQISRGWSPFIPKINETSLP